MRTLAGSVIRGSSLYQWRRKSTGGSAGRQRDATPVDAQRASHAFQKWRKGPLSNPFRSRVAYIVK